MTRRATYEDVLSAPEHLVAEVVEGVLELHPRAALRHAAAATTLGGELEPPFNRGRGGPGGWVILFEPEVHLAEDILVPDLGGWRRERLPELPDAPYLELPPDFVCEILSPSTVALDRARKLPIYARERVAHVWLVDPAARLLEVLELDANATAYRLVATFEGEAAVRAPPFEAIEIALGSLWSR